MRAHLVKSDEVSKELFTRVMDLLQAISGVNSFESDSSFVLDFSDDEFVTRRFETFDDFEKQPRPLHSPVWIEKHRIFTGPEERVTVRWSKLFKKAASYRKEKRIPKDEFVFLLTNIGNEHNWFGSLDEDMPYNGFIHTDDWDYFFNCDISFPIAYQVLALMLQKQIFSGYKDVSKNAHSTPIGCVSDFCSRKSEILLKMRTADICPACMEKVKKSLSLPEIHHSLEIMESVRVKMLYAQNFKQESQPSRLVIDKRYRILLPDYNNIEIKLKPMEKALYILFLKHPEGLFTSRLADNREELYEIYSHISTRGTLPEMRQRIDEMTNILHDYVSEKISKIKSAFTKSIGESLADHYIIQGENAARKYIKLRRNLLTNSY